jgi:hypothetical protein
LEDIGLESDLRLLKWQTRIEELQKFKEAHDHIIVPTKYPCNQALLNWYGMQRRHYKYWMEGKQSQLTKERADQLIKMGFEFQNCEHVGQKLCRTEKKSKKLRGI